MRKTLDPDWKDKDEIFSFTADDDELQDHKLEVKLWDQDIVTADDAIGKLVVDLHTIITRSSDRISGWFPIFDTMKGVRGEIEIFVKVEYFADMNKHRDSSCDVPFYNTTELHESLSVTSIVGFVEELLVQADPEAQWSDRLRSSRISNEARQMIMFQMAGEIRRKLGVKCIKMGGNAVIGYQVAFDFEEEYGLVARGIGTACIANDDSLLERITRKRNNSQHGGLYGSRSGDTHHTVAIDQDDDMVLGPAVVRHPLGTELPLLTLTKFPEGTLVRLGGVVAARSVKLLDKMKDTGQPAERDAWWRELRDELRGHAKVLVL